MFGHVCTWLERDGNVYAKFNASKLLQRSMLSMELKRQANEQVYCPLGKM